MHKAKVPGGRGKEIHGGCFMFLIWLQRACQGAKVISAQAETLNTLKTCLWDEYGWTWMEGLIDWVVIDSQQHALS